jgi:hypothetical protein
MNWFKKIVVRWVREDWDKVREDDIHVNRPMPSRKGVLSIGHERTIDNHGFNFKVHKATGGTIIELSKYDNVNDRHKNAIYVIMDDKDLGEELSKIITVEGLR